MNWCHGQRPRGARSPQLLVALLLALVMTHDVRNEGLASGKHTSFFFGSLSMQKLGYKAGICRARAR